MIDFTVPQNLIKRKILADLKKTLFEKGILFLAGCRQVGKTSLMYLLLKYLLEEKKIAPSQIFFFDLENLAQTNLLDNLIDFEKFPLLLKEKGADLEEKIYVFIDEIQHLRHPSSFLKYLFDHYGRLIKFVVSGSSTLEIKKKFSDSLVGRLKSLIIKPLDFEEYLLFTGKKDLAERKGRLGFFENQKIIKPVWLDFFNKDFEEEFEKFAVYGGFPAVCLAENLEKKKELLTSIYSLYVRKDIRELGSIEDVSGFNNLTSLLSFQIGNLINESELTSSATISRPTVRKYLFLLENTFIIRLLKPFFTNKRKEYVKLPKLFFTDLGLRNAVTENFLDLKNRPDAGGLVENGVFLEIQKRKKLLSHLSFWRSEGGAEVDFVLETEKKKLIPMEIKYQNFKEAKVPIGLKSFLKNYHPHMAVVGTRNFWGRVKFEKTEVYFLPVWAI